MSEKALQAKARAIFQVDGRPMTEEEFLKYSKGKELLQRMRLDAKALTGVLYSYNVIVSDQGKDTALSAALVDRGIDITETILGIVKVLGVDIE